MNPLGYPQKQWKTRGAKPLESAKKSLVVILARGSLPTNHWDDTHDYLKLKSSTQRLVRVLDLCTGLVNALKQSLLDDLVWNTVKQGVEKIPETQ